MKITLSPSQLPLPQSLAIFAVVPGTDRQSLRARIIEEYWALWRLVSRSVMQGSIGIVELLPPRHLSCQKMLLPPESPMVCFFTSSGLLFKCHHLENSFLHPTLLESLLTSAPLTPYLHFVSVFAPWNNHHQTHCISQDQLKRDTA